MADGPLFDPLGAHKSLTDAFKRKETSGRRVLETLQDTQQDVRALNRDFAGDLNRFSTQTDRVNDSAMQALDRLDAIDANPAVVNRVMSLFDSDYSRTTQERKLQRAQWETNRLSQQLKTKEDLRQIKLQEAGQELDLAQQLYQFDSQGFLDRANLLELGFRVEEQIDKRTADLARNASLDQIKQWRTDPAKAPTALRNKPGLIEAAYFEKRASEQGAIASDQLAQIREFEIQNIRQQTALQQLDDNALQAALKNRKLPEGISYGAAADEWERRQQVDYALMAAEQARALGDIQVEASSKHFALSKMRTEQIGQLLQMAQQSPDGKATGSNGLAFTMQELENAYSEAFNRDVARDQARNDVIIGMAGVDGMLDNADNSIRNIAAITNPGGVYTEDPMDSIPPATRARVRGLQQQINVASSLPNGSTQAVSKLQELQTLLDDYAEEQIKAVPKEQQPAYREFYEKGTIENPEAAADYLVQSLPNPATLAHDLTLGPIWEEFSNRYNELAGQDITTLNLGGTDQTNAFQIAKTSKPKSVDTLQKAAKEVRGYGQGVLFQSYAAETVVRMQQRLNAQTNHARDGLNIWEGIVNPNTLQFNEQVRDPASGAFDLGRLSQYLAAKTNVLRAKGVLQPDESLNQMLENALRTNSYAFVAETMSGSIEKAALANTLFGNNTAYYVNQAVNDFGAYTNTTLAVAAERSTAIEQQIRGLTAYANDPFASEAGPGLLQKSRDRGLTPHDPGDDLIIEFMRQSNGGN